MHLEISQSALTTSSGKFKREKSSSKMTESGAWSNSPPKLKTNPFFEEVSATSQGTVRTGNEFEVSRSLGRAPFGPRLGFSSHSEALSE